MAITVTVTETPTYVTVNETNTAITLNQSDNPITVTTTTDLTFPANQAGEVTYSRNRITTWRKCTRSISRFSRSIF